MPGRSQPPTARLRRLAAELLRLRKAAELSREAVTEQTSINKATLYRIETAKARPQTRTLKALLDLYEVDDAKREELAVLLREANQQGWLQTFEGELPDRYSTFIGFESEARQLLTYEALLIPGLLQTEDYARAVIRGMLPQATDEKVEARVAARMQRQKVLDGDQLRLWAAVDEAALRRSVGDAAVLGPRWNTTSVRRIWSTSRARPATCSWTTSRSLIDTIRRSSICEPRRSALLHQRIP